MGRVQPIFLYKSVNPYSPLRHRVSTLLVTSRPYSSPAQGSAHQALHYGDRQVVGFVAGFVPFCCVFSASPPPPSPPQLAVLFWAFVRAVIRTR